MIGWEEPSAAVRERVEAARERQRQRLAGTSQTSNADMGPAEVRQLCVVDEAGKSLLRAAMQQLQMSARAYHRILKVSRTIADLAGSERIQTLTWPRRSSIGPADRSDGRPFW